MQASNESPTTESRLSRTLESPALKRLRKPLLVVLVIALLFGLLLDVDLLAVIVDGVQQGAIYALVALGVALVYKATRVINFAQGELGTVPAFLVLVVLLGGDLSTEVDPQAVGGLELLVLSVGAVLVGALLAILVNVLVVQRLADASPVTSLVATAGVALLLTAAQILVFEVQARKFPRFVDGAPCLSAGADGTCAVQLAIGGVRIPWHVLIVLAVLGVAAFLLAVFFRTPAGIALLATSQEPFAAELYGVSVRVMSTLAWGAAGGLAAIGGILGAGVFESVQPGLMTTTFLIPALTAAVLGGMTSMVGAVVGGLLLGLTVSFANEFVLSYDLTSAVPGPPNVATFVVLLLVLLIRPRGLFGKEA